MNRLPYASTANSPVRSSRQSSMLGYGRYDDGYEAGNSRTYRHENFRDQEFPPKSRRDAMSCCDDVPMDLSLDFRDRRFDLSNLIPKDADLSALGKPGRDNRGEEGCARAFGRAGSRPASPNETERRRRPEEDRLYPSPRNVQSIDDLDADMIIEKARVFQSVNRNYQSPGQRPGPTQSPGQRPGPSDPRFGSGGDFGYGQPVRQPSFQHMSPQQHHHSPQQHHHSPQRHQQSPQQHQRMPSYPSSRGGFADDVGGRPGLGFGGVQNISSRSMSRSGSFRMSVQNRIEADFMNMGGGYRRDQPSMGYGDNYSDPAASPRRYGSAPSPHQYPPRHQHIDKGSGADPAMTEIEISPGLFAPLRGSEETWRAVQSGDIELVSCMTCCLELVCISSAEYVLCPDCKVVSPVSLDKKLPSSGDIGGVGLGLRAPSSSYGVSTR